MNARLIFALLSIFCVILVPFLMHMVCYFYVNSSKHKNRLVELGFGKNNRWYKGERIGFNDLALFFIPMVLVAYAMKFRSKVLKKEVPVAGILPCLHENENFLKFLNEFVFYKWWTLITWVVIYSGFICMFIFYGIGRGWF